MRRNPEADSLLTFALNGSFIGLALMAKYKGSRAKAGRVADEMKQDLRDTIDRIKGNRADDCKFTWDDCRLITLRFAEKVVEILQ